MITQKDVHHIAQLARIELAEEEKIKFAGDLSQILDFVEKLNEADTANVEPMTGGTTAENVVRGDEQIDKSLEGKSAELVDAAPEKRERWVKVKGVFSLVHTLYETK